MTLPRLSTVVARRSRSPQHLSLFLSRPQWNGPLRSTQLWKQQSSLSLPSWRPSSALASSSSTTPRPSSADSKTYELPHQQVASFSTNPAKVTYVEDDLDVDPIGPLEEETPTRNTVNDDVETLLQRNNIKSRPKPGGNWNVQDPLGWTRDFGRRSQATLERLKPLIKLGPGDEGYFPVDDIRVPNVTIVRTKEQAKIVLERLYTAESEKAFHACDTEVMDIDLSQQGPVGNGYVTCFSMYSGPEFDYGLGHGPGSSLWVDNLDDACGLLQEFKDWLEDERFLKVWHNVGFDRHVLWNEGINVKGFGGDTMHMARLENTGRRQYSLEKLTTALLKNPNDSNNADDSSSKTKSTPSTDADDRKVSMREIFGVAKKLKDGTDGKLKIIPPMEVLQRDPTHRAKWIRYSAHDARMTWELRNELQGRLMNGPLSNWLGGKSMWDYYWMHMRAFGELLTDMERRGIRVDAKDYLASVERMARQDRERHETTFRQWVASLYPPELRVHGLAMNPASSAQLQTFLFGGATIGDKKKENLPTRRNFTVPRSEIHPDAMKAFEEAERAEEDRANENDSEDGSQQTAIDALKEKLETLKVAELKEDCKKHGLKVSGKKSILQERLLEHFKKSLTLQSKDALDLANMSDATLKSNLRTRGIYKKGLTREEMESRLRHDLNTIKKLQSVEGSSEGIADALELLTTGSGDLAEYLASRPAREKPVKQKFELQVISLTELIDTRKKNGKAKSLVPTKMTAGGLPSVTADVLRKLAGDPFADPPKWGQAYDLCGEEGCKALFSLCSIGSIDTMISNFLTSLQQSADQDSRVHCGLNLNTETGRLSSRRPNLQNQPALEKDKYQIRKAFQSSPGNNLIVADYGQLELRILASLTDCEPMITAFKSGGDFHSRTALDMFEHIKEKVSAGEVLLEWDYTKGKPDKPLLKDEFASERRKAKTLNFSIAYGKTAHGLSNDWGVKQEEAQDIVNKWYNAFPAVGRWQAETKKTAINHGYTRTLMGRYRHLPILSATDWRLKGSIERASINTPIQGGAADVVMMAMIKLNRSQKLKDLGWILLLQIHDEVILEGPEETAEEAFEEVLQCMQEPWAFGLNKTKVPLLVDGSCEYKTWYDAK